MKTTKRSARLDARGLWGVATVLTLGVALSMGGLGCGGSSTTGSDGGSGSQTDGHSGTVHDSGHDAGKDAKDANGGHPADSGTKHDANTDATVDGTLPEAGGGTDVVVVAVPDAAACPDAGVSEAGVSLLCTGKCGPVFDSCSGTVTQCGGCAPATNADGGTAVAQVCSLATNTCGPVETTCAELNAQCGTVITSCGAFIDCPDGNTKGCAAGQQCNTDTNQCETCQPVACLDLGFQCGFAWLGCGPDVSSNFTDCGTCSGTDVCNAAFNLCEPNCTPGTAATLCAAAGAQCGAITNGCGGTVSCDAVPGLGCPSGESCGVAGEANQCDPAVTPVECVALGENCGTVTSVCTGKTISCGQCTNGNVCNANGVCGPPCTPKSCVNFATLQCGTFNDECGGTVTCGSCPNGICNQSTNTCCNDFTCSGTYPGKCGTGLSDGCGGTSVNCGCAAGQTCTQSGGDTPPPSNGSTGSCCTPKTAASYAGQCGTNLPDGCGKNDVNVACGANQDCVNNSTGAPGVAPASGTPGSCCTKANACGGVPAGQCQEVAVDSCSTAVPPPTQLCNECGTGTICNNNTSCCTPAPACAANECNVTLQPVTAGCGSARTCSCTGSNVCLCGGVPCVNSASGTGTCTAPKTCAAYPNECGTGLSNGVGGTINCGCANGEVCSTSTPGQTGTCSCATPNGMAYTCANVPNGPGTGGPACGTFGNGCGGSITCGCTGTQVCDTANTPATCCQPATCPANPAVGSDCGTISNNCGGTITCGCGTGETCDTKVTPNVCCAPTACPANPPLGAQCGTESNGCGGTNNCGCAAGDVCSTGATPNICCAPTSCPATPGVGTACGSVSNTCGGNNNCSCPSGTGNENFQCTANICTCVKDTCMGRVGVFPDGCGGTITPACSG